MKRHRDVKRILRIEITGGTVRETTGISRNVVMLLTDFNIFRKRFFTYMNLLYPVYF